MAKKCVSCNKEVVDNYVEFKIPGSEQKIIRCLHCKQTNKQYTCEAISFVGP